MSRSSGFLASLIPPFWLRLSVKTRLILLFVAIKVVPLILLVGIAWTRTEQTAAALSDNLEQLVKEADGAISEVGATAVQDAVKEIDDRSREEVERMTTDTAHRVAAFLYDRDADIRFAATLTPNAAAYRQFIEAKQQALVVHGEWRLNAQKTDWEPVNPVRPRASAVTVGSLDNVNNFHYRPPVWFHTERRPLYLEMSFIGLDGKETVKATTSQKVSAKPQDITRPENTFAHAEHYFNELKRLKPGEIYVSEVIGRYVGTPVIGKFTPAAAQKAGVAFEPEKYAYAGKENPVGRRFQGIVRWATPVVKEGRIVGWVSFALDHDHLMNFTDTITPAENRYQDINDAFAGNYAFIWDYVGKSIVHPRHHSIVGYDANGKPEVPWLDSEVYANWKKSGKSWEEYRKTAPTFVDQQRSRKPAADLTRAGDVGLDCRWLNFAPQCIGWYNLARDGGSGSFLILWSGLWKLTTAAAIPYYTGRYSPARTGNRVGFGIVTIGASVDDFHRASNASKARIDRMIDNNRERMDAHGQSARARLEQDMAATATSLILSTLALVVVVIAIAIWMASFLARKIRWLNDGCERLRLGDKDFRFQFAYRDEITALAASFNAMADAISHNIAELEQEIATRKSTEAELRDIQTNLERRVDERTRELSETNRRLSEEVQTRRQAEEKVQYLAGHDPLTGLANRRLFDEELQKAVCLSARSGNYGALLFFDLDKFKPINDELGHHVGDALLEHMARTLQDCIRKSDTAARLGGDEFAVIMSEIGRPERAATVAQRVLDRLAVPSRVAGYTMQICSSIGIATFLGASIEDSEDLVRQADIAMYLAKTEGGRRYHFFEPGLQEKLQAGARLQQEIETALEEDQFVPFFQPLCRVGGQEALYLETLIRWRHPERGLLALEDFMSAIPHPGDFVEIDRRVCTAAFTHAQRWLSQGFGVGRLLINIPAHALKTLGLVSDLQEALARHGFAPEHLAIEISDFARLDHSDVAANSLHTLREMGVEILVDQQEAGLSALQNFLEFEVDAVKIGLRFSSQLGDTHAHAMLETLAAIAQARHLALVAEGVADASQWGEFSDLACTVVRVYRQGSPMSAADLESWLRQQTTS